MAELAGISTNTVSDAENPDKRTRAATVEKIRKALKRKGILIPAPGLVHRRAVKLEKDNDDPFDGL